MNSHVLNFALVTFKGILRDRLLQGLLIVSAGFLLIPYLSTFSMRQVRELSITLSLSAVSFILLVIASFFGAVSVWRDVERRYTTSILSLSGSRTSYLFGKFLGVALLISLCSVILGCVSLAVIFVSSKIYPAQEPVRWLNIGAALGVDVLKYLLLSAVGILLSSVSTSFFLPFFGTVALYLVGSSTQQVFEYLSGEYSREIAPAVKYIVKGIYYLLPNFAAFDLKVQAIYGLDLSWSGLGWTFLYFLVYTAILLCLSAWAFARRELP